MFFQIDSSTTISDHLTGLIAAVGALGTAAYGLVDACKGLFPRGGISARGLAYIRKSVTPLLPDTSISAVGSQLSRDAIFETLRSNWINGVDSDDQQAIAKTLIKLRMDADSADVFAKITGVDKDVLKSVIQQMVTGAALSPAQTDAYARFDLMLSTILSQAYERADQQYRNTAKLTAVPVSVGLACCGALALNQWHTDNAHLGVALILGLVATPLAPIAKDLSSAVQAGVQTMQAWKS